MSLRLYIYSGLSSSKFKTSPTITLLDLAINRAELASDVGED